MKSNDLQPNHRILIVDDNPGIHSDFRDILCPDNGDQSATDLMEAVLFDQRRADPLRFQLDSAYQGEAALEMVKQAMADGQPYSLAFVDVRMPPGWDGVETIARIWEVDPEIQIVVCTAYADYSWEQMRARVGQPDNLLVLKKPFDNIEVRQLAHALTKKWLVTLQARLQIEELSQARESLAMSEERFSKAFHESPVPSAIQHLPDQRFIDVNQRFIEVTGYKRHELIGRAPEELRLWESPTVVDLWYQTLLRNQPVRDEAASLCNLTGTSHEMRLSLSAITLAGQPHALLLAQDVTERSWLERQLRQAQKMEAIGQLAAGVAHDFNNILTIIQGHSGLIKQGLDPASPHRNSVEQITNATNRATSLVRQLLMFSRKQVMQFRDLDLNEILQNAVRMIERLVGEHVQIEFQPQQPIPAIRADCCMVEQIILNLAVNARDAMPNGGSVCISTSVRTIHRPPTPMDPESRDGDFVCLTFRDTGVGMDAQILNRIFEPFFTTKPAGKGTGLGLSTVFGIVRQHHAWLEVESQPNEGTTFTVYFQASQQPAEKAAPSVEVVPCHGRETVLVAEDEDCLREMVVNVLRIQGYTVLEAASGRHALEVWEQATRPVDLLLTDLVMPGGIMGRELADRLCRRSPRLKVIYTSGYSLGMAGKDASLLKRQNFLPKPYSIGKLAQFVRECLDRPVKHNGASHPNGNGHSLSLDGEVCAVS